MSSIFPQPPPARADGRHHRNLVLARSRPAEKQAGHVGARDQQHEGDGGEQDEQRQADIADDLISKWRN